MPVLLSALLISLSQLLLLFLCGLGLARLLLPERLQAHAVTLAPVFGLALLALLGFYGTNAGLSLRQVLPLALMVAVATLAISMLLRKGGRRLPGILPGRELLPLGLLMLATWLLHIAPVLNYGGLIPIGHNWDVEFYLPLADYLKDYSYRELEQVPPNPLAGVVTFDRVAARAMGATYAQGMADLLTGRDAWDSWVPMLALLRALTLPGLYALLRPVLNLSIPAALVGLALSASNSLLLWTTYNSFGMSIGALALLPVALVCTIMALEQASARAVLAAALLLGGLTGTYWPMLQAYGAAALGAGLAVLWEQRRAWPGVVVRGVLVLLGGGLLGLLAHLRVRVAFLDVFAQQSPSMGVFDFISPAVIAGTAPYSHRGLGPAPRPQNVLVWLGFVALALLLLAAVMRPGGRRGLIAGIAGFCLLYLLGLRFVVRFPYGYLRGASYVNILIVGLAGAGLWPWLAHGRKPIPYRIAALLATVVACASAIVAGYYTYAVYAAAPGVFGLDTLAARDLAQEMERPGPVYISAAADMRGPYLGAWAYTLRQRELLGIVETGFGLLDNRPPGRAPAYGVLRHGEDPREFGLDAAALVGESGRASVYAAPPGQLACLSGRPSFYAEPSLRYTDDTSYTRAQLGVGSYLMAEPDRPLVLHAGAEMLSYEPLPAGAPAARQLLLELATFEAQTAELDLGGEKRLLDLPAGSSIYDAGSIATPLRVSARGLAGPLYLRSASLQAAGNPTSAAIRQQANTLMIGVRSEPRESGATTRLQVQNPSGEVLRMALEIYEDTGGQPAHYAWTLFRATQQGAQQVEIDLREPAIVLDGTRVPVETGEVRDGRYFAALWVYQGDLVRRTLPFLRFERRNGQIENIAALDLNAAFVDLARPARQVDARFTGGIAVPSFVFPAERARPAEQLRVSLLWTAEQAPRQLYVVFAQLLDDADRKIAQWDGAAGGDWWPAPAWQPGQRVWQDITLQVAADAPPGRYRLIVGLYDPATGVRLPLESGGDTVLLGHVEIQP